MRQLPVDLAPTSPWLKAVADPLRLHIVRCLYAAEVATVGELSEGCGASMQTLRRHLDALSSLGMLIEQPGESNGETTGRPPVSFSLAPEVRASLAGGRRMS